MIANAYEKDIAQLKCQVDRKDDDKLGDHKISVFRFCWNGIVVVAFDCDTFKGIFESVTAAHGRRSWLMDDADTPSEFLDRSRFIAAEADAFQPTHFIFNDQITLKIAIEECKLMCARIFIAHDVQNLPFGPYAKATWSDNFNAPYVCAINPGVLKGFDIFRNTARDMPDIQFLAVRSWNTSSFVLDELGKIPNITICEPKSNIEELWSQVRAILVPTIFFEAFGLVVIEAMLRGIPVISSDSGGLPEAHLDVPYVIPVNPITGALEDDSDLVAKYGVFKQPSNDPKKWKDTLRTLLTEHALYDDLRTKGRERAMAYIRGLKHEMYEEQMRRALENAKVRQRFEQNITQFTHWARH
ncbi:hypothetical protein HDV00_010652 [Rhizophlyctis rosea]|nr:hypothetical protein HDV00_010652 [Rhizophlyctis rosea]